MDLFELKKYRQLQDTFADNLVNTIIAENGIHAVNQIMANLSQNRVAETTNFAGDIGKQIKSYLEETQPMPQWANPDAIKIAQNIFGTYGGFIAMILNFRSLPMTYACSNGSKVLHETGLLTARGGKVDLTRRIMETAQFVVYAMEPNAFLPTGKAIITAQKVRLIHACIRHYLKQANFDDVKFGKPINQQDMLGTLLSFGALTMEGMEMSGFKFSNDQKNAFVHTWNVIGHWLGTLPELMPKTYDEALTTGYRIFNSEKTPSTWSKELTNGLVLYLQSIMGKELGKLIPAYLRFYCPTDIADMLGVPNVSFLTKLLFAGTMKTLSMRIEIEEQKLRALRTVTSKLTFTFLEGLAQKYNDHKKIQFYLPSYLTEGATALYKENQSL